MRKIYFNLILLLVFINSVNSQSINNIWQLGSSNINFSTNPGLFSNVANNVNNYGLASISDANGKLLLYTDGIKVWNKNHAVITNGNLTNFGTIEKIVIVPNPSNSNQYYIFKSQAYACLCNASNTLYYIYNVIEFNSTYPDGVVLPFNTSPLTGVPEDIYSKCLTTGNSSNLIKNKWSFGGLTVAKNDTQNSYWLITQNTNSICSFKIDNSGLNLTPVVSTFLNTQIYDYGTLTSGGNFIEGIEGSDFKMTDDNSKLIGLEYSSAIYPNDPDRDPVRGKCVFYKINFNSQTGVFSNYLELFRPQLVTGFEVSTNSNLLYFISFPLNIPNYPSNGEVTVKDLNNLPTPQRILKLDNSNVLSTNFSYMQKDRYGNILISSTISSSNRNLYIHSTANQNSFNSSYVSTNQLYLNNNTINFLPRLIPELVPSCQANLIINTPVVLNQNFQASNSIAASSAINNNINVNLRANQIMMKPGFKVTGGVSAQFRAYVDPCIYNSALRLESLTYNNDEDSMAVKKENKNNIVIFPNPNNGIFKIKLNDIDKGSIEIVNLYGFTVYKNIFKSQSDFEINMQDQAKGVYILKVLSDNEVYTSQIIKN